MTVDSTMQHIRLLVTKRARLLDAQMDAEAQLLVAIAREWAQCGLTRDDLHARYDAYRALSPPGYSKRWNAVIPVTAQELMSGARWWADENDEPEAGWLGVFPFDLSQRAPRPGLSVVYVLFDSANVPCYVGSTQSLKVRLRQHAKDGKCFTSWQARSCVDRDDAYRLETLWLTEFKPYLNKKRTA